MIRQTHAFGRAEAADVFVAERLQASAAPRLLLRAGDARHAQVAQDIDRSRETEYSLFLLQVEDAVTRFFQLAAELLGRRVVQPVARQRAYLEQVAQVEGGEGQHAVGAKQRGGAAEEVAGRGEPLEGGARRQQVQSAGQGAGLEYPCVNLISRVSLFFLFSLIYSSSRNPTYKFVRSICTQRIRS